MIIPSKSKGTIFPKHQIGMNLAIGAQPLGATTNRAVLEYTNIYSNGYERLWILLMWIANFFITKAAGKKATMIKMGRWGQ